MTMTAPRRPVPPLDASALDRLALRYVERFATTKAKLSRYLDGKIRVRGWAEGAPAVDPRGVAERLAGLGYIDDGAFADAKAGAMTRRGLGARRVREALRHAGVAEEDSAGVAPALDSSKVDAALTFARKRRIGPFGDSVPDPKLREKQIGAMIRGGHGFALARAIAMLAPGEATEDALADFAQTGLG